MEQATVSINQMFSIIKCSVYGHVTDNMHYVYLLYDLAVQETTDFGRHGTALVQ